jgi:NADPH:quinone reductase-like Zn-dependent oxidoreductase
LRTRIKIERPDGGGFARGYDEAVHGNASYFVWLNRGKESLTLGIKSEQGRTVLTELLCLSRDMGVVGQERGFEAAVLQQPTELTGCDSLLGREHDDAEFQFCTFAAGYRTDRETATEHILGSGMAKGAGTPTGSWRVCSVARVVRFHALGGPEVLVLEEVELEQPQAGEVLLDVQAIGLNRSEANFRRDRYLDRVKALPSGLGYEGTGRVVAVGDGVTGFAPGDAVSVLPVFKQSQYHMYGDQAVVPANALVHRPDSVDAVAGAAIWMPFLTAYGALCDVGRLRAGDHVVVTAASSSVGLAALQVANRIGAIPIATTNDPGKVERLHQEGAAHVVVAGSDRLNEELWEATGGQGAAMVFDAVAGPEVEQLARAISPDGTLFIHGKLSGQPTPMPGLDAMRPVFVRPYTVFEITDVPERRRRAERYVASGVETGMLHPVIDGMFDLDDIVAAHERLESGAQLGKIVVTVTPPE